MYFTIKLLAHRLLLLTLPKIKLMNSFQKHTVYRLIFFALDNLFCFLFVPLHRQRVRALNTLKTLCAD